MLLYIQFHKVVINYCFVHKRNTKNKNTEKVFLQATPSLLLKFSCGCIRLTLITNTGWYSHKRKKWDEKNLHRKYTRIKTYHYRWLDFEQHWGSIL